MRSRRQKENSNHRRFSKDTRKKTIVMLAYAQSRYNSILCTHGRGWFLFSPQLLLFTLWSPFPIFSVLYCLQWLENWAFAWNSGSSSSTNTFDFAANFELFWNGWYGPIASLLTCQELNATIRDGRSARVRDRIPFSFLSLSGSESINFSESIVWRKQLSLSQIDRESVDDRFRSPCIKNKYLEKNSSFKYMRSKMGSNFLEKWNLLEEDRTETIRASLRMSLTLGVSFMLE